MTTELAERYADAATGLLGAFSDDVHLPDDVISANERRLGVVLPTALRVYYLTLGGLDRLNMAHNRLVRPDRWREEGGKLVFLEENQNVVRWGVDATSTPAVDPPVFQTAPGVAGEPEWNPECRRCSDFLVVMLHWQAVMGGFKWLGLAEDVGPDLVDQFDTAWERVGGLNGMIAFRQPGRAACVLTSGGRPVQLFVGARTKRLFQQLTAALDGLGVVVDEL